MLSFGLTNLNIIYNYLYINKLYSFKGSERTIEINCHNCNCHKLGLLTFHYSLFTFHY